MHIQSNLTLRNDLRVTTGPGGSHPLPTTLRDLFGPQATECIEQGQALFWQSDDASQVFEIVAGAFRTVRVLSDGRRVITGFLFPGDIVGAGSPDRYPGTVEALVPSKARRLPRRRFEAEVEHSHSLRSQLVAHLSREMSAAQEQVVLLARKNAEERVASFLLSLVRRMGRSSQSPCIAVELPMTRLDMADYLGLTIETVSRVFTRLAKRGYIATAARHEVTILRPTALALLAVDDQEDDRDDVEIAWAS